jgi:hypothetical protein
MSIQREMVLRDYKIAIIKMVSDIALHGAAKNYISLIQAPHTERTCMRLLKIT